MLCTKCGTNVPGGSGGFCPNCGAKLGPGTGAGQNRGLVITACVAGGIALVALVLVLVFKVFNASAGVPENGNNQEFSKVLGELEKTVAATTPTPAPTATLQPTATQKPTATPQAAPTSKAAKTAAPTSVQDAKTVFANGFEMNVAEYLGDTWWSASGTSLSNPDAVSVGSNYPRTYNLFSGEVQYIFHSDTETVTALQFDEDQNLLGETEVEYRIDPYGFYIYAFDNDVNIDGQTHTVYSKFFVCDGVLYEVQMIGDDEVSNYIAYEAYGP